MFAYRYPAVVVLAGAAAGAVAGYAISPPMPVAVGLLFAAVAGLILAFFRFTRKGFVALVFVAAAAGTFFQMSPASLPSFSADAGSDDDRESEVRFFGTVEKWPVLELHKTVVPCHVDSIAREGIVYPSSCGILLTISRETTHLSLGDRITFVGRLREPAGGAFPGGVDYARYLQSRGFSGAVYITDPTEILVQRSQRNLLGSTINDIRQWILDCLRSNLFEPSAALASGFLIGETHDIPDDVYTAFRRTGTMHLLAVSGSNVALVLVVAIFLFRAVRVRPIPRLLCLLGIIFVFSHLSYNQPSVVRASIMAALLLTARIFYRRADMHNIIAAAAAILVLYDPHNLFDVGFQLSFAVTWGLILFLPAIYRICRPLPLSRTALYLLLIVSSSLIATLISAPITAYYFGEVSLITVISNLAIVPLVTAAVVGIIVLLLVNLAFPFLAVVPGAFLDRLLTVILKTVSWFGQYQWAATDVGGFPAVHAFVWLAGVAVVFLALNGILRRRALLISGAVATGYFALFLYLGSGASKPLVEIFNLGWGQVAVINRGEGAVIFKQPSRDTFDGLSGSLLPYLTRRGGQVPRNFVFMEPRHRTEQRLQSPHLHELGLTMRPISSSLDRRLPVLWQTVQGENAGRSMSELSFDMSPGTVAVRYLGSPLVLFAADPEDLAATPRDLRAAVQWCVVCCRDAGDMALVSGICDNLPVVLLTTEKARPTPRSSQPGLRLSDSRQLIVAEGESVELTVPSDSGNERF